MTGPPKTPVALAALPTPLTPPTRQRLVDGALRLFAERGFAGASVGEIEAAAGLAPRGGGLYKHFASKAELLEAALQERAAAVEDIAAVLDLLPLADLRSELVLLARYSLQELRAEQQLLLVLVKEGERFPELRASFAERLVQRGFATGAEWIRRTCARHDVPPGDAEALAAVLVGSLANYAVVETLFGEPPARVDQERFIDAWTESGLALLEARGIDVQRSQEVKS